MSRALSGAELQLAYRLNIFIRGLLTLIRDDIR